MAETKKPCPHVFYVEEGEPLRCNDPDCGRRLRFHTHSDPARRFIVTWERGSPFAEELPS